MNGTFDPAKLTKDDLEDLLAATLGEMRQAFLEMLDPEWRFAVKRLRTEDPEQHKMAVRAKSRLLNAIQELELIELAGILDDLRANAADLRAARKSLKKAIQKMDQVAKVVKGVAGVLKVLNKIAGKAIDFLV